MTREEIFEKLKLNGGDIKSVHGDSGHVQMKMVADVYSHIIDDDRARNAQRIEEAFYTKEEKPAPEPDAKGTESGTVEGSSESDMETLLRLLQKPEMAKMLKTLAAGLT